MPSTVIRVRRSIDHGVQVGIQSSSEDADTDDLTGEVEQLTLNDRSVKNNSSVNPSRKSSDLETALRSGRLDLADYFWRSHQAYHRGTSLIAFDLMNAAIQSRKLSTIRFLTERNVSLNCSNQNGETPLHVAVYLGCLDIVEYLATAGANIDAVDCHQNTPLHVACLRGKTKSVMALCGVRANLNAFNDKGNTPIICAVKEGHLGCARILVNAGARTDVSDQDGNTPIHIATLRNDEPMVQLLCKAKVDLDSINLSGYNALNLAARLGFLQVVRTLLLYGADSRIKTPNGITPDVVAFAQGHKKVGMLLTKMKPEKRKTWCEQLLNTTYLLPRIKLKLFGCTMTGKTQLTNSLRAGLLSAFLRNKLNSVGELTGFNAEQMPIARRRTCLPDEWNAETRHENYTHGFEVHITNEYTLWDFSGYDPYFFIYDQFIGDTNCIHLVLFSLLDTPAWRRSSVQFWLNFLYARMVPTKPLVFGGRPISMGRVVLIGTYADCVQCARDSNGCYIEDDATKLLYEMRQQYESKLDICQSIFLLNARDAMSLEMKQLKARLSDWRTEIIQSLPRTNALLLEVASLLPEWTANSIFQIDTWDRFSDRVREHVNPLCSDEHVETLVQHLQYTGNIVLIESLSSDNMIALSSHWLGQCIIGRMFMHESIQRARITGSYTVDDLQLFVREINTVNLVILLEAMGMACCCLVQEEQVSQHKQRRARRRQSASESDFFDQASQQSLGPPQVPVTKRHVSVYLVGELTNIRDQICLDDIQLEVPRYNFISMKLPAWEHESDPATTRYLGFELSTERGQLLHLIPRIQVQLRFTVAEIFTKGRWNRTAEECKPFTRWEMFQMRNGCRITIFEGAVEITVSLNKNCQVLHLLARSTLKHVRKTFSLVHQLVAEICDHIHSICPGLLVRGTPLYATDLVAHLEEPEAWKSDELIDTFWQLYQKSRNTESTKTVQIADSLERENQLIQDMFFGDERIMQDAMTCYQSPLSSLCFPVMHYLARVIDCETHGEAKLADFVMSLTGVEDPDNCMSLFRKGHFASHTSSFFDSLIHTKQVQTTATAETLITALEVFKRFDLIQCTYHSHLLLRLFTRRNTDK